MKRLFLFLGTNVTILFTATATGKFQSIKNANAPGAFTLNNVIQEGGTDKDQFNLKNVTLKKKGNDDGSDYVYTAVYQNTLAPGKKVYALVTITTQAGWKNATITAQLCDENGVVANAGANDETTQPHQNEGVNIEKLLAALKEGPVTGVATDLTRKKVQQAMEQNEAITFGINIVDGPTIPCKVISLVKPGENKWTGTTTIDTETATVELTATEGVVNYNVVVNEPATA